MYSDNIDSLLYIELYLHTRSFLNCFDNLILGKCTDGKGTTRYSTKPMVHLTCDFSMWRVSMQTVNVLNRRICQHTIYEHLHGSLLFYYVI